MDAPKAKEHHFYTTRPVARSDKRKAAAVKHLSLDMEMRESIVKAETNSTHRDTLNLQFLSKTQQVVRQRIFASKDPSIIDLSNCQLDQIPKFIFYDANFQSSLRELNISNNKLPSIPPMINMLKHLVVLDCTFNRITELPVELADLTELQHLNLSGNPLTPALKQFHLLGTNAVLQHLQEKRKNTPEDVVLRKRDRISKLLNIRDDSGANYHQSNKEKEIKEKESKESKVKSPKPKLSNSMPVQSPPQTPTSADREKDDKSRLIGQMKIGLEDSTNLPTSSDADSKHKSFLQEADGRSQFKFNTYCNASFSALRNMGGVTVEQYKKSIESFTALGFSGKSGSVLLRSGDNLLVLKTISPDESSFLRRILTQYCEYMKKNPNTVLTCFWGLYKVVRSPIDKVCFVVMKNAFSGKKKIHERYDLKGSTVGRYSGEENIRLSRVVLKDLDLCLMKRRIRLGPSRRPQFLAQITSDCKFLEKFEIIDYSLIYGIHYIEDETVGGGGVGGSGGVEGAGGSTELASKQGEILAKDEEDKPVGEIYFMTIIDVLQPFNLRKQMEYNIKSIKYGDNISVIPPSQYASRFIAFITAVVD